MDLTVRIVKKKRPKKESYSFEYRSWNTHQSWAISISRRL